MVWVEEEASSRDLLIAFGAAEDEAKADGPVQVELDLLVIEQGSVLLGVLASAVDAVIPWQAPEPLPRSSPHVLGVVQDRGRLVAVHRHPDMNQPPRRLAVCATSYGLVGLAVTGTRQVGTVSLVGEARFGTPLNTSVGDLTLIDPEQIARQMVESQ